DILLDSFYAPTRHGGQSGVSQGHLKALFGVYVVELDLRLASETDGEVVVHRLVIQEILLYHVAAISEAEDKLPETTVGIKLHDVPEDGTAANFDHRFGPKLGLLAQARTEPTAQHNYLHEILRARLSGSFPSILFYSP